MRIIVKNTLTIILAAHLTGSISAQNELIKFQVGNLYGYRNSKTQKVIFEPKFSYAEEFKDGLAVVQEDNGINSSNLSGRFRIIKENGTFLNEDVYGSANNLGKGLVVISKAGNTDTDKKQGMVTFGTSMVGIINNEGQVILPCEYNSIGNISDSLIVVSQGTMKISYGVIDLKGNFILPLQNIFKIDDFQCGVAIIRKQNQVGLLGKNGQILIDPAGSNFYSISKFNKFCIAEITTMNSRYGLINSDGKIIVEPTNTRSSGLSDKGVTYKEAEYNGNGTKKK